ncbi:MAG: PEP-CTERM sorting domain-containing protein [Verrucomicrobiales bacterium]
MAAAAHAQIAIQDDFNDGDDAGWVRINVEGRGNQFTGSVFDLANLAAPIVSLTVDDPDSRYAGGNPGLFVFDNSDLGDGTGDVTFDNFAAGPVPEPAGAALLALAGTAFLVRRRRLATA